MAVPTVDMKRAETYTHSEKALLLVRTRVVGPAHYDYPWISSKRHRYVKCHLTIPACCVIVSA